MQVFGVRNLYKYKFSKIIRTTTKAVLFKLENGQELWLPNTWVEEITYSRKYPDSGYMYLTTYGWYRLQNLLENND